MAKIVRNIKTVKTFAEVVELVRKKDFCFCYQPENVEDLPQVGPRVFASMGALGVRDFVSPDFLPKFQKEKCTQCGACWVYCPLGIVHEDEDGYFDNDEDACRACGVCAHECPAGAIEMVRLYK